MNYLELPAKEMIAFVDKLKKDYGVVILERPAEVIIDENKYGIGWVAWRKTYKFSMINKDGKKEHITIQNGDGNLLYAVNKHQHKFWKNLKIVSEPVGWNFFRLISCFAQISFRCNLVSPTVDLYKFCYFLRNVFNKGESNGKGQERIDDG